jgi:hypothetical protein
MAQTAMNPFTKSPSSSSNESQTLVRRFKIGDRVKILPVIETAFVGLEGTVRQVLPHDRDIITLDRYGVEFDWGETQSFYDAQLTAAEERK